MTAADPSPPSTPTTDAPPWFRAALAQRPDVCQVAVDGAQIAYRAWGEPGRRGLVLIHGGGAHSRWWDHVAPLLAADHRVAAMDLSGHGDSGRREAYGFATWAREALAVAADAGITEKPVVIGHSMGGMVALGCARDHGSELTGAIAIDSPMREMTPEEKASREKRAFGPLRVHAEKADILARFRPVPDEGPFLPYVLANVAEHSVRQVAGGWSWKFDRGIFAGHGFDPTGLHRVDCRVAFFRAERGMVSEQMGEVIYDRLGQAAPIIEIPAAGHHVMLDEPLSLVTGLRTLLADWDHSTPTVNG